VAGTEYRAEECFYEHYISSDTIKMTFCNNILAFKYKQEDDEIKEFTKNGCTIVGAVRFDEEYYCFNFEFDVNKHEVPPLYASFSPEQQTIWLTVNQCMKKIKAFVLRAYFGYNEPIDFGSFKPQNA